MVRPIIFALAENAGSLKDTVGETFAERAGVAGSVTLLGMVAIFVVLALLWGVIEVLHRVLNHGGKTETEAAAPVSAPKKQPAPRTEKPKKAPQSAKAATAAATAAPTAMATDDGALVAVITAAVAAAMAEDGYQGGFRVVSFRRMPTRRGGR